MQRKKTNHIALKSNLVGYYIAIGIIILGYVFLSIGSADSITSRTLGPVVIVIGYIIAVPIALLYGAAKKNNK